MFVTVPSSFFFLLLYTFGGNGVCCGYKCCEGIIYVVVLRYLYGNTSINSNLLERGYNAVGTQHLSIVENKPY